jgi:drug/metabolite transporter (DMT)-like permease
MAWAAGAGLAGAIGIVSLYRGLASGSAALVAPTSGVITAVIPVVFSMLAHGWPTASQFAAFAIAVVGIWLVAAGPGASARKLAGLELAVVAGLGFGCFLVAIAQVPEDQVFGPLAVARVITFSAAVLLLVWWRTTLLPSRALLPMALLAGALDAGGNVFFLLARQHVRVDIAAVLSSFYPVATVALSRVLLEEPVTPTQWLGAAACLAAVGLITG